jgi:hypothetical protein
MKNIKLLLPLLFITLLGFTQSIDFSKTKLNPVQVSMNQIEQNGEKIIVVLKDTAVKKDDEATFVKLSDIAFQNGSIEINVLSKLKPDAPAHARGFIGIAFRINNSNDKFECIYIRPTNGRVEQQLRRNRSIQYFSFPDFKFDRLRKEAAGEYESYADMGLNEWIKLKITVDGQKAKLYLNHNTEPSLVVNDLKHGADLSGAIGLFVDIGTEGFFKDLKIIK